MNFTIACPDHLTPLPSFYSVLSKMVGEYSSGTVVIESTPAAKHLSGDHGSHTIQTNLDWHEHGGGDGGSRVEQSLPFVNSSNKVH